MYIDAQLTDICIASVERARERKPGSESVRESHTNDGASAGY